MPTLNTSHKTDRVPMDSKTRVIAETVLAQLQNSFGCEGLKALHQAKHAPEHATPWQKATASHIRVELGPETFWLEAALSLWAEAQ